MRETCERCGGTVNEQTIMYFTGERSQTVNLCSECRTSLGDVLESAFNEFMGVPNTIVVVEADVPLHPDFKPSSFVHIW